MKGWRTIVFNVLTIIVTIGTIVAENMHVLELSGNTVLYILIAKATADMYLRKITTSPLGKDL